MIAPNQFKFVCSKCGYEKLVKPKSDVVNIEDDIDICPKCKSKMERKELSIFDKLTNTFL